MSVASQSSARRSTSDGRFDDTYSVIEDRAQTAAIRTSGRGDFDRERNVEAAAVSPPLMTKTARMRFLRTNRCLLIVGFISDSMSLGSVRWSVGRMTETIASDAPLRVPASGDSRDSSSTGKAGLAAGPIRDNAFPRWTLSSTRSDPKARMSAGTADAASLPIVPIAIATESRTPMLGSSSFAASASATASQYVFRNEELTTQTVDRDQRDQLGNRG